MAAIVMTLSVLEDHFYCKPFSVAFFVHLWCVTRYLWIRRVSCISL